MRDEIVTIRFQQSANEYQARMGNRVIGTCVYLEEANGSPGLWRYTVEGRGGWTTESREEALRGLHTKCLELLPA